ncbi:MAG: hypothetical protein VKK03_05600 [Synechococcus sp.]|nr:hypothetical protein [Synechococcus sp.]
MSSGIELTTEQQFHLEQFNRALDATSDPAQLRQVAKQLLQAWQTQKAATNWVIRQQGLSPSQTDALSKALPSPSP